MTEKSVFISSCTRRQLARRRSARLALRGLGDWRYGLPPALLIAGAGLAAFVAGRGGI